MHAGLLWDILAFARPALLGSVALRTAGNDSPPRHFIQMADVLGDVPCGRFSGTPSILHMSEPIAHPGYVRKVARDSKFAQRWQ